MFATKHCPDVSGVTLGFGVAAHTDGVHTYSWTPRRPNSSARVGPPPRPTRRVLSVYVGVWWGGGSFQVRVRLAADLFPSGVLTGSGRYGAQCMAAVDQDVSEEVHEDVANPVRGTLA
jgi:hypothetical protein